jgi:hypothetical protein
MYICAMYHIFNVFIALNRCLRLPRLIHETPIPKCCDTSGTDSTPNCKKLFRKSTRALKGLNHFAKPAVFCKFEQRVSASLYVPTHRSFVQYFLVHLSRARVTHRNLRTSRRMHLCMQDDQIGRKFMWLAPADMARLPHLINT